MNFRCELIYYVIFGILTTLVNIAVYLFFTRLCCVEYIISNILAWILSVLFAYFTNRIWVFESKSHNIVRELSLFFAGRLFSGIMDMGLMYLFIDIFVIGDFISKIIIQIIVVFLNYIISKFIVFKTEN